MGLDVASPDWYRCLRYCNWYCHWYCFGTPGKYDTIPADLVLKSIGFKSVGIPGVGFDARAGVVPNKHGQVRAAGGGLCMQGVAAGGWLGAVARPQQARTGGGRKLGLWGLHCRR